MFSPLCRFLWCYNVCVYSVLLCIMWVHAERNVIKKHQAEGTGCHQHPHKVMKAGMYALFDMNYWMWHLAVGGLTWAPQRWMTTSVATIKHVLCTLWIYLENHLSQYFWNINNSFDNESWRERCLHVSSGCHLPLASCDVKVKSLKL